MTKNAERREKFRRIREELSVTSNEYAWRVRHADFEYEIIPTPVDDPALSSRFAGGPEFVIPQFVARGRRTVD